MAGEKKIITVGLCPCWDTVCRVDGIEWGEHKQVASIESRPAGKALNISRALAWMRIKNTAAGLWGCDDFARFSGDIVKFRPFISDEMTVCTGITRHNITIVNLRKGREMHLRAPSELATKKTLRLLDNNLQKIIMPDSICIFSGSMPGKEFLPDVLSMIKHCYNRGAKVVVDTSGMSYRKIVAQGNLLLIKPNVEELRELTGKKIKDTAPDLVKAARGLLDKTEMVLISRGAKGAIVVSKDGAVEARCTEKRKIVTTVACGDYLLAGFLAGLVDSNRMGSKLPILQRSLELAIQTATARAWGLTCGNWTQARNLIKIK
jgi:1-phosphofructokinase family hexose kinase